MQTQTELHTKDTPSALLLLLASTYIIMYWCIAINLMHRYYILSAYWSVT